MFPETQRLYLFHSISETVSPPSNSQSYMSKGIWVWRQGIGSFVRISNVSTPCPVVICPYSCTSEIQLVKVPALNVMSMGAPVLSAMDVRAPVLNVDGHGGRSVECDEREGQSKVQPSNLTNRDIRVRPLSCFHDFIVSQTPCSKVKRSPLWSRRRSPLTFYRTWDPQPFRSSLQAVVGLAGPLLLLSYGFLGAPS